MQFYFDIDDGAHRTIDDEGVEFDTLDHALADAASTALAIARERLGADGRQAEGQIVVSLRKDGGCAVAVATVTLQVQR
jgi:hypothetical protein